MKSYTDLNQSKKLAEILPMESADMAYILHSTSDNPTWRFDGAPMVLGYVPINEITAEALPCWSLAALLALLPKEINVLGTIYSIDIHTKNEEWFFDYKCNNEEFVGVYSNILVDACYEMTIKLHELNLL